MAKTSHDVKVPGCERPISLRQQLVQFLFLLSLPPLIYTFHGVDFDGSGGICRSEFRVRLRQNYM